MVPMDIDIFEIYKFYTRRLIASLRDKPFSEQIEELEKIHASPLVFDFCGLTKRINYVGDVYIVYDYRTCHNEIQEMMEGGEVAIFLLDRHLNAACFGEGEDCMCILCNRNNKNLLIHFL